MKIEKYHLGAVAVIALQFVGLGCNSNSNSSSSGSSASILQPMISTQNQQFGASNLQGVWSEGCIPNNSEAQELSGYLSSSATLTFAGNQVSADFALYSDSSCQTPLLKEHQQGTYVLSSPPDSTEQAPGIDYNITDETVTYFDQSLIDSIEAGDGSTPDTSNDSKTSCDMSKFTFKVGIPQDVSSQEGCMHQESIGQERYSVIKVDGQHLYMGTTDNGSGDGDYPDTRSKKLGIDFLTRKS